jgi:cbb3-type cytochrome oxidase subunit 3
MVTILIEGALFIALVAVAVALVAYGVWVLTPAGRWARQRANRRRIERLAALTCPIHGYHPERDLVRLPGGALACPECYAEVFRE